MTQIPQWDLDELQQIAAGFSNLHGKKSRTTILQAKGRFLDSHFQG